MKTKESLPIYGVGPIYGAVIIALTVLGMVLSQVGVLNSGKINGVEAAGIIIGVLLIIFGISVWARAVFVSKVDNYITSNHLCKSGIYGEVRNPCYAGIMITCTGILFFACNLWLLLFPIFYWAFMTILMKNTEEKWLKELYGQEYIDYCKQVNRCIPWLKRR